MLAIFAKENCFNLQLPIRVLKENDYFRHASLHDVCILRPMSIFSKHLVSKSVKNRAHKFICKNISSCINLQLTSHFEKKYFFRHASITV